MQQWLETAPQKTLCSEEIKNDWIGHIAGHGACAEE
jgi:hypothetical protein